MEWQFELKNIKEIATLFWKYYSGKRVFAFHGDMGSGKTTFIHALCDAKNVRDIVGSPTFSIINEYDYLEDGSHQKIFHLDLYRLKDEQEARDAGVEDCLYSGNICLVEWPERAVSLFPEHSLHVYLKMVDDQTRIITISDK
jgi:tRNA threonylcarbamoyladenosine biosynthesis protein TsaE